MHELIESAIAGDVRALGKALSVIEDETAEVTQLLAGLPDAGNAQIIGITGPPGVGKSTTTGALISEYRKQNLCVAVLAVDPSSPVTGVGQSEVDVVNAVDTVVLVLAPGAGDGVQAAKAGILEIADIYVVNKADRDGAEGVVRELRSMIGLGSSSVSSWTPAIMTTTATTGQGLPELVTAIKSHQTWATESGNRAARAVTRANLNLRRAVLTSISESLDLNQQRLEQLSIQVAQGTMTTAAAVDFLLQEIVPNTDNS